jgi:hypothetical protein
MSRKRTYVKMKVASYFATKEVFSSYKTYTASANTVRSFFCGKKRTKKATVKRYTTRLTDTSLFNNGTTVASTVDSLYTTLYNV